MHARGLSNGGGLASYPPAMCIGKDVWLTEHLNAGTSRVAVPGTRLEINCCMNADMNASSATTFASD